MTYEEEIKKMEQEDKIVSMQAKSYLNDFVRDIKKLDKDEMIGYTAKPVKMKIPFKVKIKRFFERLNKTLG